MYHKQPEHLRGSVILDYFWHFEFVYGNDIMGALDYNPENFKGYTVYQKSDGIYIGSVSNKLTVYKKLTGINSYEDTLPTIATWVYDLLISYLNVSLYYEGLLNFSNKYIEMSMDNQARR